MRVAVPDDPYVEGLLTAAPARAAEPLARRELRAELGLGLLVPVAVVALSLLLPGGRPVTAAVPLLVIAYAIAQRVRFDVGAGYTVPSELVLVPMLLLVPPELVPVLVAGGMLAGRLPGYLRREIHPTRLAFVLPDALHAIGPAVVVAALASGAPELRLWPVYVLALVAQVLGDALFGALRDRLALGVPPQLSLRLLTWVWAVDAALAPVGLLAALVAAAQPLALVLVLPLMALFAVFARERRARIDHALELSRAYRGTALLMGDVLESADAYTGGEHSHGVVLLALEVGAALGLEPGARRDLELGALLHDVGKIRVPQEILNKPGRLTEEEFAVVRRHPADGQEMLERIGGTLAGVGLVVRHHHERWDGAGYPDGIAGADIPLASRVISACDAFSAMTTNRAYRAAMPVGDALAELRRCAGAQFDPEVTEVLVSVVESRVPPAAPEPPALRAAAMVA